MPFTALFILFDQIIQDPNHEDTHGNLALLESVTGYFSALEYATNGYLPGSMLMPFASIARQFHSTSHASRGDNVSTENSDQGTTSEQSTTEMLGVEPSTHSQQIPWEVSAEDLSVLKSAFLTSISASRSLPLSRILTTHLKSCHQFLRIISCYRTAGSLLVWRSWISFVVLLMALISFSLQIDEIHWRLIQIVSQTNFG